MPALTTIIAGASLAVSGAGAYSSYKQGKKASKAQAEALSYEKQQNDLAAMRQKREAVRQARIERASATNAAATGAVLDSSPAVGGLGSIQSQLGDNLSFLDQWNTLSDQASEAIGRANRATFKSQTAGDISKLAMGVFNNSDIIGSKINKIFKNG